jgi:hypothetical protein
MAALRPHQRLVKGTSSQALAKITKSMAGAIQTASTDWKISRLEK